VRDAPLRQAFANENAPKPEPTAIDSITVEIYLIVEVRRLQSEVNKFIRGYLEFEEFRNLCRKARRFADRRPSFGGLQELREEAWEPVIDGSRRIPPGLEDLQEPINVELDQLRELVIGSKSPIYASEYQGDDQMQEFFTLLSRQLTSVDEAIGVALGHCMSQGLTALDDLKGYVESIFHRTDEAKRAAASRSPFRTQGDTVAPASAPEVDAFTSIEANPRTAAPDFGTTS
jgi:hypothetical protein